VTATERTVALAARWVACYTRRLPTRVAQARRDELASDLWEHSHDTRERTVSQLWVALSIARRVVCGVPADLSWRFAQLVSAQGGVAEHRVLRQEAVMTMSEATRVWVRQHLRTRKCKGCSERYTRKYTYCPVCKAAKGTDGTRPAGFGGWA
jgi:hypothetical protein